MRVIGNSESKKKFNPCKNVSMQNFRLVQKYFREILSPRAKVS